jgi:hypothetical protein
MPEGRILYEEGDVRFVEVSALFDVWSTLPVQQMVARFQHDYYEVNRNVTLQRPDADNGQIKTFVLSFEEMGTLVAAYQSFLIDREVGVSSSSTVPLDGDFLPADDHPF